VGSSGKKRTTMAKLNRENKLRLKRADKQARKAARKNAVGDGDGAVGGMDDFGAPAAGLGAGVLEVAEPEAAVDGADPAADPAGEPA
jgi:hypothetical protein